MSKGISGYGDLELSKIFFKTADIKDKSNSILEIGCGIGTFLNYIHHKGYKNIKGIDISNYAISYGKKNYPYLDLEYMNAGELRFKRDSFNVCSSFDLVEHLEDISNHFKQVHNILKNNGTYIFQTPNKITNVPISIIRHKTFTHWKTYHPSLQYSWGLIKILKKNGFRKIRFLKIPPLSQYKLQQIPKFARWILKIIPWKALPIFLQTNFYVQAYK